ncbi:PH, RCC1 and FYVE domains-containing protein 1 [Sesamum alatum]|uniref:PH, RCC1 and FYVE domains-containing protein 1 n=1 Tax=Sesamum alatum TaxID=300844 RepID=A0AAE1Y0P8_9LAMI|nr:PH, RCC1 and FYVE domains-containing protein 1 [Sesamum alatum]
MGSWPIFQRYPRPEKEYQSFSLIYNDRSLDLIRKDKEEVEVWSSGLKAWFHVVISDASELRLHSPYESSPKNGLDKAFSDVILYSVPPKGFFPFRFCQWFCPFCASGCSDSLHGQMKGIGVDAFIVSLSSAVSSSSQGSSHDDGDALGDVFIGEKLIDALNNTNIELVACGEYHSSAVTRSGDLYTWGDGHFGLLGHGNEVSQWVPKRVKGQLEGIHVSSISCGRWHTAVVTSAGQLFTFGDGTFGVLGHGGRESISKPREVESLKGLRTVRATCGVWHTAAVVEVMVGCSSSSNCSKGKVFTWGDGDRWTWTWRYGIKTCSNLG